MLYQILVSHVSFIAEDVPVFGGKALGDGGMHVLVLRKHVPRLKILRWFADMSKGLHLRDKDVSPFVIDVFR